MTVESPTVARPRLRLLPGAAPGACPPHPAGVTSEHDAAAHVDTASAVRCRRWTLITTCIATALLLFNVTAPNVALPSMSADLRLSFSAQQWVLSSYALVLASLLLGGGAIGDRLGRKRLFLVGLTVFAGGSVIATVAGSSSVLVGGRCVQGLGAALLFPSALALIAAEFDGRARARAIGIWGATVSAAIAAGPLLGGVLVQAISWRATFLVGLALAVPTGVLGALHLRESRASSAGRVDVAGTVVLTAAMFLAVFALLRGNQSGWTSVTVLGSAIAAVLLFGLFVAVEHRVSDPLIAPALMRNRTFVAATLVALVFAGSGFGPIVFLTQLLIRVLGGSPIAAGAELLPFAFASFVVSLLAARVVDRTSTRGTLVGGLLVCTAGLIAMRGVGAHGSWTHLIPGFLLWGVGSGLVNPTMTVAALAEVPPSRSGMASGVNNAARQLGIAAGIAALGALVQSQTTSAQRHGMTFGAAYAHAVDVMLLVAGGVAAAGAVIVVALVRAR